VSSVAPAPAALAAPHAFAEILREAPYRRLWFSGLCVNGARWMDLVLLGWLAFQLTDSPFMVAVAAFARSAPMMLLGPFTGLVADRMHRGRVLVFTQALGLATALALAAVFAAGRGGFWPMVGLKVLFGALWALDFRPGAPRSTRWWARAAWPPRSRSRPSRVGPTVNRCSRLAEPGLVPRGHRHEALVVEGRELAATAQ
jgi:MFS family permease